MIKAILAVNEDNLMGKNGKMPWESNKKDMRWFMDHTSSDTVLMGSKTWDSPDMPSPLPNRTNVVVSSKDDSYFSGANMVIHSNDELREFFAKLDVRKDVWIIGGANLLKQCGEYIDEYYVTIMKESNVIGPTTGGRLLNYFPLDSRLVGYKQTFRRDHKDLTFEVWSRK